MFNLVIIVLMRVGSGYDAQAFPQVSYGGTYETQDACFAAARDIKDALDGSSAAKFQIQCKRTG